MDTLSEIDDLKQKLKDANTRAALAEKENEQWEDRIKSLEKKLGPSSAGGVNLTPESS